MKKDIKRTQEIINMFPEDVNICIYDCKTDTYFGKNMKRVLYPASMFKIFIGASVLEKIEKNIFTIEHKIEINSKLWGKESVIFPDDINKNLCNGNSKSIDELLSLMLGKSDNTATHTLLALVGIESVEKILRKYGLSETCFTDAYKESLISGLVIRKSEILESTPYDMMNVMQLVCVRTCSKSLSPPYIFSITK